MTSCALLRGPVWQAVPCSGGPVWPAMLCSGGPVWPAVLCSRGPVWPAVLCSEGAMVPVFLGHVDLQDLKWCILDWTWEGGGGQVFKSL